MYCAHPENGRGGGSQKPKYLKEVLCLTGISRGVGYSNQKPSMGGYGYFLDQHIRQWFILHRPHFFPVFAVGIIY